MTEEDTAEKLARAVLAHHRRGGSESLAFAGLSIRQVARSPNGVVWRSDGAGSEPVAIKVSLIDERERGQHEFAATKRIASEGLDFAPRPITLVADGDLTACVSTWCEGESLVDGLPWDSSSWSDILDVLATLHCLPFEGLSPATPEPFSIEGQLNRAAAYADRAGRRKFSELTNEVRRHIGGTLPRVRGPALIHADNNLSNVIVEDGAIRLVDWEYSGIGDPCGDIADLCTSPSVAGMPEELIGRLILEHAVALGDEELALRTHAFVVAILTYWCARIGAPPLEQKLLEVEVDPRRDAAAQIDFYRNRLAAALDVDRSSIDRALEV